MLDDQTFHCHSEIDYSDDADGDTMPNTYGARQCAGVTTLLLRTDSANQAMRIAGRLGEQPAQDDRVPYRSLADWVGEVDEPEAEFTGEACNTVEAGCTAPAGWGGSGGGVVHNVEADAEHRCHECGEAVCDACATHTDDGPLCGFCEDMGGDQ